jgi:hypothetical protein
MRYFFIIYPYLAILAGMGFTALLHKRHVTYYCLAIIITLIWPLMYLSIYLHPHSRITASNWIYAHVPSGSLLLNEYWDDPLPLPLAPNATYYPGEMISVFDPDTPEKWQKLNSQLRKGDYYILSSNRGWGSIPSVPEHYPLMTQYYNHLFNDQTDYHLVAEFTAYPALVYLGIPLSLPDQWADESFTVYDHPKVMIYKREK